MVMQNTRGTGIDLDDIHANRQQVLVIEDEPDTITLIKHILRNAGYNVMSASSGQEALHKIAEKKPDLVLLDLMMPEMDGWEIYHYLRQMTDVPVIIISALGGKDEIVRGLHLGVDDYISKPFHNAELIERVKAVLRRTGKPQGIDRFIFPRIGLIVDINSQEVMLNNCYVELTPKEFAVLVTLAANAPSIVRYETIAQAVWKKDTPEIRNRTKYLVYLLRRKFQSVYPEKNIILNLDRRGYKLLAEG